MNGEVFVVYRGYMKLTDNDLVRDLEFIFPSYESAEAYIKREYPNYIKDGNDYFSVRVDNWEYFRYIRRYDIQEDIRA